MRKCSICERKFPKEEMTIFLDDQLQDPSFLCKECQKKGKFEIDENGDYIWTIKNNKIRGKK